MTSPTAIAIVGAGPAGLTLARILSVRLRHVPLSQRPQLLIFERDADQHSQADQIGTLDLHTDTGLAAMEAAELMHEFQKHARYDGEELVIADKNGTEMVHLRPGKSTTPGVESSRPEIDRATLVDILLDSVGRDKILRGKRLIEITQNKRLHFDDGSTYGPFDLIDGADGAWSRVRPVLTNVKPAYSGICGFESLIVDPDNEHYEISKLFGRGAYFAFSDCKAMMAHRLGNNNIKLNFWIRAEEDFHATVMKADDGHEQALRKVLHEIYADWLPIFRNCIDVTQRVRSRALYELPIGDTWQHVPGITLK